MGRRHRVTIALPGERRAGRRSFLKKGLVGAALLAIGGGTLLATRRTVPPAALAGVFRVFSREELAVLLAIAERLVPPRAEFPRPAAIGLAARLDAVAAQADPATQKELRQLVRLFESALAGFLLDGEARLFTASPPERQDRRIAAWARSRIALRRTGHRALRRLVLAAYYSSPETWDAVGYPGPPLRPGAIAPAPTRKVNGG